VYNKLKIRNVSEVNNEPAKEIQKNADCGRGDPSDVGDIIQFVYGAGAVFEYHT
jgi:hypothetical protein